MDPPRIDELVTQGKATRGGEKLPDWFFTIPRPKADGSVLEQLLKDRRSKDY